MGYTTEFQGSFEITPQLDGVTFGFLIGLNETRRMKRDMQPGYGIDGEFFVRGSGWAGQAHDDNIIDYNKPPCTQPGLWCGWRPSADGNYLEWDGREKFYNYVDWLSYIIHNVLEPRGYKLNGDVRWRGEEFDDIGAIMIEDNEISLMQSQFAAEDSDES